YDDRVGVITARPTRDRLVPQATGFDERVVNLTHPRALRLASNSASFPSAQLAKAANCGSVRLPASANWWSVVRKITASLSSRSSGHVRHKAIAVSLLREERFVPLDEPAGPPGEVVRHAKGRGEIMLAVGADDCHPGRQGRI